METHFSFDRRLWEGDNEEVVEPLEVTLIIPDEISKYLKKNGTGFDKSYSKKVINSFKDHFIWKRFYKEPSFKSEEVKKVELVAYRIARSTRNPFLDPKTDSPIELKPKYKPKWVDTDKPPSEKHGFTNELSTFEFCDFDPITGFTMNAYYHLD